MRALATIAALLVALPTAHALLPREDCAPGPGGEGVPGLLGPGDWEGAFLQLVALARLDRARFAFRAFCDRPPPPGREASKAGAV